MTRTKVGLAISLACWATLFGMRLLYAVDVQHWFWYITTLLPQILSTAAVGWYAHSLYCYLKNRPKSYRVTLGE